MITFIKNMLAGKTRNRVCVKAVKKAKKTKDKPNLLEKSGHENLTDDELKFFDHTPACPDCLSIGSIILGPSGGGAQNVMCFVCGHCFNLMGGFGDHRNGIPTHMWTQDHKKRRDDLYRLFDSNNIMVTKYNNGISIIDGTGIWYVGEDPKAGMTQGADLSFITILTWSPGVKDTEPWKRCKIYIADPNFISKIRKLLRSTALGNY